MAEDTEVFLMRDVLNSRNVAALAERIHSVYPDFKEAEFHKQVMAELPVLSIGDRTKLIKNKLYDFLPKEYPKALSILTDSLLPALGSENMDTSDNFIIWPLTMYVSEYGSKNYDISMEALREMTKRFSAEFGIRALLDHEPVKSFKYLEKWSKDTNCHVRRLVSEGTRPRLPWAGRFKKFGKEKARLLSLLEILAHDPTELVRRSVANHLNDIAKEDSDLVITTLEDWKNKNPDLSTKLIKHALRTLIKKGDKEALRLLGVRHDHTPVVKSFTLKKERFKLGDYLEIQADLSFGKEQKGHHVVDYVVHFLKSNGNMNPKVFKWRNVTVENEVTISISKRHLFKNFTTRVHYHGLHYVVLQVNGQELARLEFNLEK